MAEGTGGVGGKGAGVGLDAAASGVTGGAELRDERGERSALAGREKAVDAMSNVHVGDRGADLREDGERLALDVQVIGVNQEADARMGDLLRETPALGDSVEDVGFLAIEMFEGEGHAMGVRHGGEVAEEIAELPPGGDKGEAGRDVTRTGAAENDNRYAEARGRGEGLFGVAESGREIGSRAGEADFGREEIVTHLAGETGALDAGDERGEGGLRKGG